MNAELTHLTGSNLEVYRMAGQRRHGCDRNGQEADIQFSSVAGAHFVSCTGRSDDIQALPSEDPKFYLWTMSDRVAALRMLLLEVQLLSFLSCGCCKRATWSSTFHSCAMNSQQSALTIWIPVSAMQALWLLEEGILKLEQTTFSHVCRGL